MYNKKSSPAQDLPTMSFGLKVVGNIGYARNMTNMRRNLVRYPNFKTGRSDTQNSRSGATGPHNQGDQEDPNNPGNGAVSTSMNIVPKYYRKVAVKLSKMGTDDFDFDRYNR